MSSVMSILNSPLVTMVFVFGSVQILRFFDITNPNTIRLLRMGYLSSQMLMLMFWLFIRSRVNLSKKTEMVEVEEQAVPFSGEVPKKSRMSITDYDNQEVRKQIQQIVIGTIFMLLLHAWLGFVQPLFLQIILPWKSIITQPLVQIYLFGVPASGPLKRPFKQPNPFSEFMGEQTAEPTTNESTEPVKAVIEEIEDSSNGKTETKANNNSNGNKKKKGSRKED